MLILSQFFYGIDQVLTWDRSQSDTALSYFQALLWSILLFYEIRFKRFFFFWIYLFLCSTFTSSISPSKLFFTCLVYLFLFLLPSDQLSFQNFSRVHKNVTQALFSAPFFSSLHVVSSSIDWPSNQSLEYLMGVVSDSFLCLSVQVWVLFAIKIQLSLQFDKKIIKTAAAPVVSCPPKLGNDLEEEKEIKMFIFPPSSSSCPLFFFFVTQLISAPEKIRQPRQNTDNLKNLKLISYSALFGHCQVIQVWTVS